MRASGEVFPVFPQEPYRRAGIGRSGESWSQKGNEDPRRSAIPQSQGSGIEIPAFLAGEAAPANGNRVSTSFS